MSIVLITINGGVAEIIGGTTGTEVYILDYDTGQEPAEVGGLVLKEMTKKEIKQFIKDEIQSQR